MQFNFRRGLYAGLTCAVVFGLYLAWLWQPARQVRLHSLHLVDHIEEKDWPAVRGFIADDYFDDWGHGRDELLYRMREAVRYARNFHIELSDQTVTLGQATSSWSARVRIEGEGEVAGMLKERINTLALPFELDWRRDSSKPWDWKLVLVTNPELSIPALP